MNFAEFIRSRRQELGLTQKEVADFAGVSRNYIVMIEKGEAPPPSDDVVRALEDILKLDPGALIHRAHLERASEDIQQQFHTLDAENKDLLNILYFDVLSDEYNRTVLTSIANDTDATLKSTLARLAQTGTENPAALYDEIQKLPYEERLKMADVLKKYLETKQHPQPHAPQQSAPTVADLRRQIQTRQNSNAVPVEMKFIPLISKTAAGNPTSFTDGDYPPGFADDYVPVTTDLADANAFALRIEGDSMEPVYKNGDIVIVSPNLPPEEGMRVVAKVNDDEITCKTLAQLDDEVVLRSENARYGEQRYPAFKVVWMYPVIKSIRNELAR